MKTIEIKCEGDLEFGEGKLIIPKEFDHLNPIKKADLLNDWISDLTELYNSSLEEWKIYSVKN